MKYIVLDDGHREIPFLFSDQENHIDIATAITSLDAYKSCKLVAAGFLVASTQVLDGNSQSLKINSRGAEDEQLINCIDYAHGVKDQTGIVAEILDKIKKNVAVVCGRHLDWENWQPALAVVRRERARMRLETEHCVYWGILNAEQARGLQFDTMEIVGNPSVELVKLVNSRLR